MSVFYPVTQINNTIHHSRYIPLITEYIYLFQYNNSMFLTIRFLALIWQNLSFLHRMIFDTSSENKVWHLLTILHWFTVTKIPPHNKTHGSNSCIYDEYDCAEVRDPTVECKDAEVLLMAQHDCLDHSYGDLFGTWRVLVHWETLGKLYTSLHRYWFLHWTVQCVECF